MSTSLYSAARVPTVNLKGSSVRRSNHPCNNPGPFVRPQPLNLVRRAATEGSSSSKGLQPEVPMKVLELRVTQQELELGALRRAYQQAHAEVTRLTIREAKQGRVLRKGLLRGKELSSQARLLQTKLQQITSRPEVADLHNTIEEQQTSLEESQAALERSEKLYDGAHMARMSYTNQYLASEAAIEEHEYRRRQAEAKHVEAIWKIRKLEAKLEGTSQWYEGVATAGSAFGQFLFQNTVKKLFNNTPANAEKTKSEKKDKQGARFL